MIVPDVNLLVYAINADAPQHERARVWWDEALSGSETVGMTWLVMTSFLRLTTHSRVFRNPMTSNQALAFTTSWLAQPCVEAIAPGDRHWLVLSQLLRDSGTAGNLTNDAHLAAIAIEHDACLHSADNDFHRFPGLKHHNPLAPHARQGAPARS
ncbi:MAG: type II toxin-antitoxin system VapC family toxin [Wenzhouxiangella sp.]|nr:type II toxin-antitoxin system VapC family toxin [Wenzhouxiangella sp.]